MQALCLSRTAVSAEYCGTPKGSSYTKAFSASAEHYPYRQIVTAGASVQPLRNDVPSQALICILFIREIMSYSIRFTLSKSTASM